MIDIRNWTCSPPSLWRYSHMASLVAGVNQECSLEYPGWVAFVKNAILGYPADINKVNTVSGMFEQVWTEGPQGYTDPTSWKQFVSKDTPSGGINWAPLDLSADSGDLIVTKDSSYVTWQAGKIVGPTQNVGEVAIRVEQPQTLDVGVLKGISVVIQHYYWGSTEEQNWWAAGYGQVRWQGKTLNAAGKYDLVTDNVFDQVTLGPTPKMVLPTGFSF
jgi:hypothetical protein